MTPMMAVCHMPTTIAASRLRPKKSVPNGYCQARRLLGGDRQRIGVLGVDRQHADDGEQDQAEQDDQADGEALVAAEIAQEQREAAGLLGRTSCERWVRQ